MDAPADFDINEAIKNLSIDPSAILTPEAPSELLDCEHDPESLTPALINGELNRVVDAVARGPDAITQASNFDTLQFYLKLSSQIPATVVTKILDLIVSALEAQAGFVRADFEADEQDTIQQTKQILEMYGFLLRWTVSAVEMKATEKPASAPARGRKGPKSKSGSAKDGNWDPERQLLKALKMMSDVLSLRNLPRIFVTTSERSTFVDLFTKPVQMILENEARVKDKDIRMSCYKVWCLAVKNHGWASGAQTQINQNLTYYEHLSEPMAEFLQILAQEYAHAQLSEEVLRDVSTKEFNSNDLKGPKSISTFLTRISELLPHLVIKQMTLLQQLLESESYALRCGIIEVCGNIITMLSRLPEAEHSEHHDRQIRDFFDLLEQRFLDLNPYCRSRVMQVYIKLCDLEQPLRKPRERGALAAARSLEDKSSNVRRNAIKLLSKCVQTHSFRFLNDGLLDRTWFANELKSVDEKIDQLEPPPELREISRVEGTVDESMLQDATQVANEPEEKHPNDMTDEEKIDFMRKAQEKAQLIQQMEMLRKLRKVYAQALNFAEVIDEAADVVSRLLSSKNKSEVIEAMDFFVLIDGYRVRNARVGIRRMLHLIWTKGNNDEGKGIQSHLIECYKHLYFNGRPDLNAQKNAVYVAENMISFTYGSTPAELTSLEQLLSTMMKQGLISNLVIERLWQVYGYQKKETSRTQRRGAIIILGMLALADPNIIVQEMESCLRIGLGALGRRDLGLARYTCIALKRISPPTGKQTSTSSSTQVVKLPNDHAVLVRLAAMAEIESDSKEWFGVAEQSISAIYALSRHPDVLCSEVLRRKTKHVFGGKPEQRPTSSGSGQEVVPPSEPGKEDVLMEDAQPEDHPMEDAPAAEDVPAQKQKSAIALSQLLFVVGHVAFKQIVHMELCEIEFKRRKAEKEKKKEAAPRASLAPPEMSAPTSQKGKKKSTAKDATPAPTDADELDLMAGTTEDDFTEHMQGIRERELLYGPQSLLANFGPMVSDICANNTLYNNSTLQAQAALCLGKLMCVSGTYCDANLSLLLTILERSNDPAVRSNLVLALGDMAVCFNNLIDENTDFLYRRLKDNESSVKRTCLMTLTFLILAGQIKVKGQLGEMAKCIEDSDKKISDMARMFFTELATKDNAVYNQFVDMFSLLTADTGLDEDAFKRIVKFLAGFIEKDKHAKQLAHKLYARLPRAESERQWNDIAFTLGQLQHKDEDIQKTIAEGFKHVQAAA